MAVADLMRMVIPETPEEEQIRLQQAEAEKINIFEGWDDTAADDLLFSPPSEAEAPADYARNTLQAYYSKELGVDSLPEMAFNQFIKEDFGEGTDYETALASLQETKRWGTEARNPTKLELAKHEKLTAGDWLRSFSANTTKAVTGIDAGLMRAAAAGAAAIGKGDSVFYETMMGAADDVTKRGQEMSDIMTGDTFFKDITSDEANNDIFAQNLGQLMIVVPLGIATGGTSWGVSLATVGSINSGMLFNEGFQQAREDGQDDKEALKTAGLYTLAAAPTETIVDLATAGVFKPFTKYASSLSGEVRQRIVRTAIQGLTAAGPGGFVEGGQYALLNKLTNRKIDQGEFWATVRAGAILEGLGGSITQVAGEVDSARAKVKLRKDFKPVFGNQTDAVVDRIMGDGDPNNALNREVLNLVTADFKAISLLGEKNELRVRAEAASDAVYNELWKQAGSEQEAALKEEIQKQAELEAHETPDDIVIPEPAPATAGTPVDPAKADREKAKARKEQEKIRADRKKRKATLLEAMTIDSEQKRSYLKDDGTEVYEDGTPVEGSKAAPQQTLAEDTTPPPINRIDPNNGSNLARLTLAVMDNEKLSQEQALQRVAALPSATRKRYLEILDDGTMETIDLTPEEERIQAIDDELEAMGRAPQPPQTRTAFPEGLTSARIKALKNSMTREQAEQMYADGDQKNDFIAAVFDGDRKAVQRFNARSQGREIQMELPLEATTSYEQAAKSVSQPQPVVGETVTLEDGTQGWVRRLSEDGTIALVDTGKRERPASPQDLFGSGTDQRVKAEAAGWVFENAERGYNGNPPAFYATSPDGDTFVYDGSMTHGGTDPWVFRGTGEWKNVLLSKLTRGKQQMSEEISKKVAEKLPPVQQEEVSAGAKVFRTLATQDYTDNPDLTVAENLAARNDFFFSKLPELASALGVTEDELLVDGRQAELVDKLAEMMATGSRSDQAVTKPTVVQDAGSDQAINELADKLIASKTQRKSLDAYKIYAEIGRIIEPSDRARLSDIQEIGKTFIAMREGFMSTSDFDKYLTRRRSALEIDGEPSFIAEKSPQIDLQPDVSQTEKTKNVKTQKPVLRYVGDGKAGPTADGQKLAANQAGRIATLRLLNEKTGAYPDETFDEIDPSQIDEVLDYMIGLQKPTPPSINPVSASSAAVVDLTKQRSEEGAVSITAPVTDILATKRSSIKNLTSYVNTDGREIIEFDLEGVHRTVDATKDIAKTGYIMGTSEEGDRTIALRSLAGGQDALQVSETAQVPVREQAVSGEEVRQAQPEEGAQEAVKPPNSLEARAETPVFVRDEIEVGKPQTSRRKRENGTDGETTVEVKAPFGKTQDAGIGRIDFKRTRAFVQARLDFDSGKQAKKTDSVWSVWADRNTPLATQLTYEQAIERAKDFVETAKLQSEKIPNSLEARAETTPDTLYQAPSKKLTKILQDQGLTAEEAKQLASTKTEKQTIADIQTAFSIPADEAAGVVAVIQSLGLDVNNFVFQEDKATAGKKYIAKTQFIPQLAKALVTAGKQANTETAVHEVAHVARRFLLTKGFEGAVETDIIDTVETEYGVKDGKWTRAQEEQFAEHFVDFIKTGESPSQATDTLFQKMSNWIRKVTRLFTKQNQGVSEDMQKIFSALMQRGQISQTVDEQISQLEEEVKQAREGRNKKQTDYTPRDENDVPFTADEPVVQFRKAEAERILGRVMGVTEKTFFDTVEIARQKGLIDNAVTTAKNILADPERPITDEEFAGMAVMNASIDERKAVLDVKIAEAHRQAEENAKRGGEQRGGFNAYLGKLQAQYQQLEVEQRLLASANALSATTTSRSLGIRRLGINQTTLEPDTVIRNINNQREKPLDTVTEADIRSSLKGVKTKQDALRAATLSIARAKAESEFLYMMKQGGKKLQYGEASDLAVRISQGLNSEGMTPEIAMAMNNLANGYIAEGETTLDGLTEKLLTQFSDEGLTEQDAWYAVAGRFINPKAVTELQHTSKILKKEAKLSSQVFDAFEGIFEQQKVGQPITSKAIEDLTNKYKLLRSFYEQDEVNPEKRKRTLAAIDEAQKQLDQMYRPVRYTQQTLDAESQALQDTLKDLRGQISDKDTKAKIDEALKTWSTPYVAKGTAATSEARAKTKADLKEARDMMRMHMAQGTRDEAKLAARLLDRLQGVEASYDQMYSRLPSKKVMEPSEAIKDLQSRLSEAISAKGLQTRILNVQDLITNFSEEKYRAQLKELELNPVLVKESERITSLRTELAALNKHLNAKMERAKTGTVKFWMREILSINKAVLLSGDMPVLRQGGIVTANPFRANFFDVTAKSAKVYWSGLTKGTLTEQVISDITKSKHFTESIRHGMQYPDSNATLTDGEMMVGANVAEKIPVFGRLISGSNQAQAAGIMLARYQAYESYRIKFPNASDAEMRAWADVVMTSTGKSTSEMVNRASTFMDVFIISTKYMASRFETMFKPLQYARTQPRVAREALKDLLWFFGTRVALVGLLKSFMGDKVDMGSDPLKSTFMKIMVDDGEGSTRVYDPFSGIAQPIRLVLGMPIKAVKNMNGGHEKGTPIEDTLRFLRARATPFVAMADGLASGKNYFGKETGRGELALRSYAPLPMQDLYDSIQASQDPFDMSVSSFFNVMGVNSYFDKTRRVRK